MLPNGNCPPAEALLDWSDSGRVVPAFSVLRSDDPTFPGLPTDHLLADVDDILAGLDHLRFDGHNVVVFHTLDPYELAFPFTGTWRFDGLEEEVPLTTQPERIREDYLTSLNAYVEAIGHGCVGSNVDYTLVDTSRPLDAVLGEFMDRRASAFASASAGARQ